MKKLFQLEAPAIAGVIREFGIKSAIAEMQNCRISGADMIDLHMSCLENTEEETLRKIFASSALPVLALNYNKKTDWTDAGFSEEERLESFVRAARSGAAGIDMQGYSFHAPSRDAFYGEDIYSFTKNNPKEVVTDATIISKQCEFIEKIHALGAEVLLSCHPGIPMQCEAVVELALFLEKRNPDCIKIVTAATNENEMLESIKTMLLLKKEIKTPVSYHANGKFGKLTRILNPALGGQIAFCVDRFSEMSTMEQLDLKTAKTAIDCIKRLM